MIRAYFVAPLILLPLLAVNVAPTSAQQSQCPIMEKIAQKVIEKYQRFSCEQLAEQKKQPPPSGQQAEMMKKAVGMLKNDPKMRQQFLNKVAAPIANKMFECGMIP